MVKFVVNNNVTFVSGCPDLLKKKIGKLLSFRPSNYFWAPSYKLYRRTGGKQGWDGIIRMFFEQKNFFQTGLLPKVLKFMVKYHIPLTIEDRREAPKKRYFFRKKVSLPPIRNYQSEAITKFTQSGRGIINLPMGSGKTRIALEIIEQLGVNTIFICPNLTILDQTLEQAEKWFGKENVGAYSGEKKDINKPIVIACIDSLPDEKECKRFEAFVWDEFHHASCITAQLVNIRHFGNSYYRLGLTATLMRTDGGEMKYEGIISEVIYQVPIKDAIQKGWLVEPTFLIADYENTADLGATYPKSYAAAIVINEDRNNKITQLATYCKERNFYTLILVQHIEHGEILEQMIDDSIFIHADSPNRTQVLQDFKDGKIKTVIATEILGEGSDIPILQALIIAGGMKAEGPLIQKIGRALRLFPNKESAYILDICDKNHKIFKKHAKERLEVYKKYFTNKIQIF